MASSPSSSSEKMIVLKSSDGQTFEVPESAALQSLTVKNMIEDDCVGGEIPLQNVDSATLTKVLEFCREQTNSSEDGDKLKKYNYDFANSVKDEQKMLFDLILAANYLNIQKLLDLLCEKVADMMKGKSPEEIRKIFHIINDYSPEEEAEVRKENSWAFE